MAYIGRPLNAGNLAVQSGTGDGSDTTPIATLNYATTTNGIAVYLDGVRQLAGTDYNVTAQTTLTFTTAPANGVGVDVYFLGLEVSIPTPADSSVSTAKIVDNAVTLAKMAGGTDGQIITYDASGDPVAVGPGTDGQVLTSTGAGSPPAFEDAAAGGAFTLISTSLISTNTSSITLTGMSSTYSSYMITFSDMIGSANNSEIRLRVGDASAIDAGLGDYSWHSTTKDANGGSQSSVYGNDGWWALTTASTGKDGTEVSGGIIYFHNSPSVGASRRLMMSGTYVFCDSAGTSATIGHSIIGHYDGGVTVDRVNFEFAGQNVASGRMSLYGIAHA